MKLNTLKKPTSMHITCRIDLDSYKFIRKHKLSPRLMIQQMVEILREEKKQDGI